VLNSGAGSGTSAVGFDAANYHLGVLMVMGASMLSGLSAALTQRALVGAKPRHPLFFSAELAVYGIVFLLVRSLFADKEKELLLSGGLFNHWSPYTLIPVITNVSHQPHNNDLPFLNVESPLYFVFADFQPDLRIQFQSSFSVI
jgi:hypothetical protein